MSTTLDVGFDLDGVVYPLVPVLHDYARITGQIPDGMTLEPTLYDFGPEWGLTSEQFVRLMHEAVDAGYLFREGDPHEGAAAITSALRAEGHRVHIITSRFLGLPGIAETATALWLRRHGIEYDTLTFSRDKTVVRTDVYVDDLPSHYDALELVGTHAVLMDASYNRDPACTRRRVTNLAGYAEIVGELAALEPAAR